MYTFPSSHNNAWCASGASAPPPFMYVSVKQTYTLNSHVGNTYCNASIHKCSCAPVVCPGYRSLQAAGLLLSDRTVADW